jgi:hypothetical protein
VASGVASMPWRAAFGEQQAAQHQRLGGVAPGGLCGVAGVVLHLGGDLGGRDLDAVEQHARRGGVGGVMGVHGVYPSCATRALRPRRRTSW